MLVKTLRSKVFLTCLALQLVAVGSVLLIQTRLQPSPKADLCEAHTAALLARVTEYRLWPIGQALFDQPVLLLLVAVLVSLGMALFLASILIRPIVKLTAAVRDVAAGDLHIRLPGERYDEVGQLSASLNALVSAFQASVQAFNESEKFHLQTLRQVQEERTRLSTLLNALGSGILLLDGRGQVLHTSPRFLEIWQIEPLAIGTWVDDIIPVLMGRVCSDDGVLLQNLKPTHSGLGVPPQEMHLINGCTVLMRMQTSRDCTTNTGGGIVWLFEDVTKERRLQSAARYASRDPMTDLLNRRGFNEVMSLASRRSKRGQIALVIIDLDDFKRANDVGGHQVGDEILVAVGRTLSSLVRRTDHVARLGGDEFAVLLTDLELHDASVLANRIIESVSSMKFQSVAGQLSVGCSIGVAIMLDPIDPKALYVQADGAMYQAKRSGKNTWFICQVPDDF